jgi:crossover junction endonuclease MUS81
MIKIIVDCREKPLYSLLKERDLAEYQSVICLESQQLDIGDIHIIYNDNAWVFERKTVNDLLASIKDGRYHEQKARILSISQNSTYIIEGDDIICQKNERNQNVLSSVYIHSLYRDDIKVIFTKDVKDTCTFLLMFCVKLIENPHYFHKTDKEYVDCIKMKSKKIENITPDNCFIMQLSQIPNISARIAKSIQQRYPTMKSFIKALDESNDKISLLCDIDKIGKEKAKKILHYMCYNDV